ncbi:hypothetical protein [Lactiplantibacillus daowaiensis]|uniref:DNA-directed RNA polymerase beta subunit n=1 Tax=Lactiplantibacillus daowaiensis TaxID=2559918 RepID=A0ABW1S155_9LACO|nr:hypothetical protein [Lactiplantibacillus daowaiensis]
MSRPEDTFDLQTVQDFFDHVYHDRGMVKWQGFYLSDHTSALKKQHVQTAQTYPEKPQQTLAVIGACLQQAYLTNQRVSLQLNERDQDDRLLPDLTGHVTGYYDTDIVLDGRQFIALNRIRHVTLGR